MATPNIVPKAISEGGLGTSAKAWGKLFISNPIAGGTPAVTITNSDADQHGIALIALNTTADAFNFQAFHLTTAHAMDITCNSLTTGSAINLDINDALTTDSTKSLVHIDYDKSGVTADGQESNITALNININDSATNHANSTVVHQGVQVVIDAASNQGTIHHIGYAVTATDSDTGLNTIGFNSRIEDGGIDFKAASSASASDFFTIKTGAAGATNFKTIDAAGTAAHFLLQADGNITLDSSALTNIQSVGLIKTTGAGVEIENAAASGTAALLIDNDDVDEFALRIDANNTTADVVIITAPALNGGSGLHMSGADGQNDIKIVSSADAGDFFTIGTTTHGATTLTTVDDDAVAAHFEVAADGNITLDSAALTNIESVGLIKTTGAGVEIENSSTSGAPALLIDNDDVDEFALHVLAANTTIPAMAISAPDLTTSAALNIVSNHASPDGADSQSLMVDVDFDGVGTSDFSGIHVDLNKDGITASGKTATVHGLKVDLDDSVNNVGTVHNYGVSVFNNYANAGSGATSAYGLYTNVGGADTNYDIYMENSADATEYAWMAVGAGGKLDITTVSDDESGHTRITADGNLTLNASNATTGVIVHGVANTTTDALKINTNALTTAYALNIDSSGNLGVGSGSLGGAVLIDVDEAATSSGGSSLLKIDYDKSGVTGTGESVVISGIDITMDDAATNHANCDVGFIGIRSIINHASAQGSISNFGAVIKTLGADVSDTTGIQLTTTNGAPDIEMRSSAVDADKCTIMTDANGATTLETVDTVGALAHLALIADGNVDIDGLVVTLDAATSIELEAATNVAGAVKSTGAVTGRNYRTMYIDAGGMVPAVTNGAIANTEEMHATNFTTLDFLSFSTSTEQYADFKMVMPEQYNNGTIKAKFYWKPADAEASVSVVWGIKAYAATDSDALTGASGVWGTEQVIEDVSLNTVDDLHISATTPAITIAGTPAEGKLVFVRVFRKVAASDDDYADAAELLGVNLQYVETETASAAW